MPTAGASWSVVRSTPHTLLFLTSRSCIVNVRGIEQLDGPVLAGPVDGRQRAGSVGADRDPVGARTGRREDERSRTGGTAVEQQAVAWRECLAVDGVEVVPRARRRAVAV